MSESEQVRRSVRVVYADATETEPQRSVPATHAVPTPNVCAYDPAQKVDEDPFIRALMLRDMEREWKALHHRWRDFEEFTQLVTQTLEVGPCNGAA